MQWNGGKKMKNSYYNEIVNLLMEHPDGVPVRKIARQIYNTDVNLFDPDSAGKFRGIHLSVQRFLWSQSRKQRSPFERKEWGTYALKKRFVFQLELEFEDWEDEDIVIERPEKKRVATDKDLMQDIFAGLLF